MGGKHVRDLMKKSPAVVWIYVLGAGLALAFFVTKSVASPQPPKLIGCVFIIRRNVTCRWEPGDLTVTTNYTLQVQRQSSALKNFTCSTSGTSCTAGLEGSYVRFEFCIRIIAHTASGNTSSKSRCQSGRKEAILPPVTLDSVQLVRGAPKCLNILWSRDLPSFSVSDSEIKNGHLNSQIEISTQEQVDVQVRNVTVTVDSIMVCLFRPDTSYIIRLRNRYQGPESPWSSWSNSLQGRTAEDAPSASPVLWRQIEHTNINGRRLISLLWKPLPHFLANGRIVSYKVICQTEDAQVLSDHGSCTDLQGASTSCSLSLPAGCFSCSLTASTSAGASPEAQIWSPDSCKTIDDDALRQDLPPPSQITVTPMDDSSLELHWKSPWNRSVSGFVVEWFAVREKNISVLHWEKLNSSSTKLLITEGVKSLERYAVSVKALYGNQEAGENGTIHVYTRQGTPSAGPNVKVQHISGSSVELSWSDPPVELLHGFICNYTLFYTSRNQPAKRVVVPANVHCFTLENMSPGIYDIFMQANTVAGAGPAGNLVNVLVGSDEISIIMYVLVPIILMVILLMLIACLTQIKMVKQKLSQSIPDPSNSTLSHWTPDTSLETKKLVVVEEMPEVNYSKVILLDKKQNLEKDHGYHLLCNLQSYSPLLSSSSLFKTSDQPLTRNQTEEETNSICIYSNIIHCQPHQTSLLPLYEHRFSESPTIYSCDIKLPADEAAVSLFQFSTSEQKNFSFIAEHLQSYTCLSDLSKAPSLQTEISNLNSVLSLKKDVLFDDFRTSAPSPLLFVDMSYCPVRSGPSIPSDV